MATETIEHAEQEESRRSIRDGLVVVGAGMVTGLLGGVLMLVLILAYTVGAGLGASLFPRAVAGTFHGVDALVGGAGVVALGTLTHLGMAMVWGIVFAWLVRPQTTLSGAFAWAVAYAIGVWLFMTYAVLPALNPVLGARVQLMPVAWIIAHLLFAVGLCFAPRLRRMVSRTTMRPPQRVWQRGSVTAPAHG